MSGGRHTAFHPLSLAGVKRARDHLASRVFTVISVAPRARSGEDLLVHVLFRDNLTKRITVAIDGPAGAGKSTIARVASPEKSSAICTSIPAPCIGQWHCGRCAGSVALSDMHRLEQLANEAAIEFLADDGKVLLNEEDVSASIRTPEVGDAASVVSRVPACPCAVRWWPSSARSASAPRW